MKHNDTRKGSALFTVMGVILTMSMVLGSVAKMSAHRTFMAMRVPDRIRALAIAEAGANEAYSILSMNFLQRTNAAAFPPTSYGKGAYDADVVPVGIDVAVVYCTGVCRKATVSVILDVKKYHDTDLWGWQDEWDEAFSCAIAAGGDFDFGGSGDISTTNGTLRVHSNSRIDLSSNAGTVNMDFSSSVGIDIGNKEVTGNITAPDFNIHSGATIDGNVITQAVPTIPIPDIDLTPYALWAEQNGEYKPGDFTWTNGSYAPVGGILYVDGDVLIESEGTFTGSIIANGNIHISGNLDVVPSEYGFAVGTRDGSIKITSSGDMEGLFYARNGDFSHESNGALKGQVIVAGTATKTGVSGVVIYEVYLPIPPDLGILDAPIDTVGISAYQK